ncbi:unnamed protein product [Larinioides sclopetarius]|uniref:Transcriptional coactivator p15 (PC4) C-terminal domain-containing protein n=1 Tax=Larinioides sclopetarius TaxID=280406 RepID=A0AAV1Z2B5_9ARAC
MSSKKSRKSKLSESDSDSGPDDRNPPAKKVKNEKPAAAKNEKPAASTSDDGGLIKLARNRYVSVREFRGKVLVDIREFYEQDGELKPGKKRY